MLASTFRLTPRRNTTNVEPINVSSTGAAKPSHSDSLVLNLVEWGLTLHDQDMPVEKPVEETSQKSCGFAFFAVLHS